MITLVTLFIQLQMLLAFPPFYSLVRKEGETGGGQEKNEEDTNFNIWVLIHYDDDHPALSGYIQEM